jgi:hypothetical protein
MLVRVEDVDVVAADEKIDDRGDEAFAGWAVDEEDGGHGGGHRISVPAR